MNTRKKTGLGNVQDMKTDIYAGVDEVLFWSSVSPSQFWSEKTKETLCLVRTLSRSGVVISTTTYHPIILYATASL